MAKENEWAELLFEYLGQILYSPNKITIDIETLPEEFHKLGQGLKFLEVNMQEYREFAARMKKGDFSCKAPTIDNVIAAPLKDLQGVLRHLTWQTQQISKGDYGQTLDFMGDFAEAFNDMTRQLAEQRQRLLEENEKIQKANVALMQNKELILKLVFSENRYFIIMEAETNEILYFSDKSKLIRSSSDVVMPKVYHEFYDELIEYNNNIWRNEKHWEKMIEKKYVDDSECKDESDGENNKWLYFSVFSQPVVWEGINAIAHVIDDDTAGKMEENRIIGLAYTDALTGLFNRRYGVEKLEKLIEEDRQFCLVIIDLDDLKICNDRYGHEEGDTYLRLVAEYLGKISGERVVCRLGGDEFMIIKETDDCEALEGELLAIRKELMSLAGRPGTSYNRRYSFGICNREKGSNMILSDILTTADKNMYKYKFEYKMNIALKERACIKRV